MLTACFRQQSAESWARQNVRNPTSGSHGWTALPVSHHKPKSCDCVVCLCLCVYVHIYIYICIYVLCIVYPSITQKHTDKHSAHMSASKAGGPGCPGESVGKY